jgi:DNA invertase Pin-like site-specific DNA recombinase
MRAAIWCAVSTSEQAGPDKISLTDQEARCRAAITQKGWQEANLYVVPGESRTRYVNLRDAEEAIPDLRRMLNDCARGRFDLLVMYDYNRLRDLLDPVSRVLSSYGVQMYSLNQPIEPVEPSQYNPNRADSVFMMQGLSQIVSKAQLSDLRRKYESGMPARVRERGLPAVTIPFGYRKPLGHETDRAAVPVQNPNQVPLLLELKNKLLAGWSTTQLAQLARLSGIKPPRGRKWYPITIREILRNPFYAGFNRWGMSRNFTDLRTGKRRRNRDISPEEVIIAKGRHEPLWDEATHQALIAELDRRGHSYAGVKVATLSHLLKCGECGSSMWMNHNGPLREPGRAVWRCSRSRIHPSAANSSVLTSLGAALEAELVRQSELVPAGASNDESLLRVRQRELADLQSQRRRLEDAYLAGGFDLREYIRRGTELDIRITASEDAAGAALRAAQEQHDRMAVIGNLLGAVDHFDEWLSAGDPQEINQLLRQLLDHVAVGRDGKIKELAFR